MESLLEENDSAKQIDRFESFKLRLFYFIIAKFNHVNAVSHLRDEISPRDVRSIRFRICRIFDTHVARRDSIFIPTHAK